MVKKESNRKNSVHVRLAEFALSRFTMKASLLHMLICVMVLMFSFTINTLFFIFIVMSLEKLWTLGNEVIQKGKESVDYSFKIIMFSYMRNNLCLISNSS